MDYEIWTPNSYSIFLISFLLCGSIGYSIQHFTRGVSRAPENDRNNGITKGSGTDNSGQPADGPLSHTRSIVQAMAAADKNCVIFFGSQTGTAEDYATRLAKEGASRYSLRTMLADLEDYDFDDLESVPDNHVIILVLATYGEGDPTDNSEAFYAFITERADDEDVTVSLSNLNYAVFGLGNSSYEKYNAVMRRIDGALRKMRANSLCPAGEGDDGEGSIEDDFLTWKEVMWGEVARVMGLKERVVKYEPTYNFKPHAELTTQSPTVYLGEPTASHKHGVSAPHAANSPYVSNVVESRELFRMPERNCIHMEFEISGSGMSYDTGDHVAIWPMNSSAEVDRFLAVTNLASLRNQVVTAEPVDSTSKPPFPCPTTYDSIARYYLDICGPVSRQFVSTLVPFAPDEVSRAEMTKLANDKDYFSEVVSRRFLNIAQLLERVGREGSWETVPFSAFVEGLHKLQPRFYSISSSSTAQPQRIAITAVVESRQFADRPTPWKGVSTNYLFAVHRSRSGEPTPTHTISGPRDQYDGFRVPIHVRKSSFRLPADPARPVIMIGPGTGVAPFRGFLQERGAQLAAGRSVGKMVLFYGFRSYAEDFMYADEWEVRRL